MCLQKFYILNKNNNNVLLNNELNKIEITSQVVYLYKKQIINICTTNVVPDNGQERDIAYTHNFKILF